MKKVLLLLTILFLPFSVFAYSSKVIVGGDTLGIKVDTNGAMIIGFYKIDSKYNKGKPSLEGGDYILKINDEDINTVDDMTRVISSALDKRSIKLLIRRNNKEKEVNLPLVYSEGKYKTGLYVKDSIKGIGTLTYIDPETKIFGALGHEIIESDTNKLVEIKSGVIFNSYVTGISKSSDSSPGSKLARFNEGLKYGNIYTNTMYGIFGKYEDSIDGDLIDISSNVKVGPAIIRTVINGTKINEYHINITNVNENSNVKNITFEITDPALLNATGGVIQGMSGSPIIQGGYLVGALTHVIVDNPITGYGLLITKMLNEGDKLAS